MLVGFGLVIYEYFYDGLGLTLMWLLIFAGAGALGLIGLVLTLREYIRNWYWHEIHKEHIIGGVVVLIILFLIMWHYGVLEWLGLSL